MIYQVEVYHSRYMGSWSDYYLVEADNENDAKEKVMTIPDIISDNRLSKDNLIVSEIVLTNPHFLYSDE